MFFSDIASFTTIVESLPPKSSLLLLSRYFQELHVETSVETLVSLDVKLGAY